MINKQSIWFLTLFSLILVLSVYYITMPNELLLTNNSGKVNKTEDPDVKTTITESEILTALRVEKEEQRSTMIDELNKTLNNSESSIDDKNNAFEKIKDLNSLKGKEQQLEKIIKETYNVDAFIKIENNNEIRVVISGEKHNTELANNIMRSIQQEFENKMYISVNFQGN